jgi:hypothetical protein
MPVVTVNPVNTISVRVNQATQTSVPSTTQFIGATSAQAQIDEAKALANAASAQANTAYALANSVYGIANTALIIAQSASDNANTKLSLSGGTITGNLTVSGTFNNANETVDAGTF